MAEKILEHEGVSVETLDLSEVVGRVGKLSDTDPAVLAKYEAIKGYAEVSHVPSSVIYRMAKFGVVVDAWVTNNRLNATTIQCWTAIEENLGIFPCPLMSMMS